MVDNDLLAYMVERFLKAGVKREDMMTALIDASKYVNRASKEEFEEALDRYFSDLDDSYSKQ